MEGPKREISLESPEAEGFVHDAIQGALKKIGGIEMIFNQEEAFGVDYKVWTEFFSEVFRICREHNLTGYSGISMDKENHRVLGVTFLRQGEKILVPYSE